MECATLSTAGSGGGQRGSLKFTCGSTTATCTSTSMAITFLRTTIRVRETAGGSQGGGIRAGSSVQKLICSLAASFPPQHLLGRDVARSLHPEFRELREDSV